jgi:hypothetical protein
MNQLLTEHEKARFVPWLRQEAATALEMAEQMSQLPSAVSEVLVKKEKLYAMACTVVADKIDAGESVTVER